MLAAAVAVAVATQQQRVRVSNSKHSPLQLRLQRGQLVLSKHEGALRLRAFPPRSCRLRGSCIRSFFIPPPALPSRLHRCAYIDCIEHE